MQRMDWQKHGALIKFSIENSSEKLEVFTTTRYNFWATFIAISPQHELAKKIAQEDLKL